MDMFSLKGKKAIVTGASSGLGAQFAKTLARAGADVAIVARRFEKLEALAAEIETLGVRCLPLRCDVLEVEQIKSTVAAVKTEFGRIDILVNNAGVAKNVDAQDQSDEDWSLVINTNLNSVYYFAREVGKVMIEQQYGRIINLGSIHSRVAMQHMKISGYCSAKGGVFMLTKDLATEWAQHGITVNAIGPSYFHSEMTASVAQSEPFQALLKANCPMGRMGNPEELDGALLYFASDAGSFTTGQLLQIDGGWTAI
jgi:gluconate 5-dehydrogenase